MNYNIIIFRRNRFTTKKFIVQQKNNHLIHWTSTLISKQLFFGNLKIIFNLRLTADVFNDFINVCILSLS